MKKVFVALSLMMFVGSVSATAYAATTGTKTEISKKDDKEKKKKKKKKACCSAEAKGTEKKCCSAEKK